MSNLSLAIGDLLFRYCYPLYVPLYSLYKAWSDRKERAIWRDFVKPGMTIVDIGANIGIYTQYLAAIAGRNGSVYAFEPSKVNCARLRGNVQSHHNVTIVEAAVGERSGTAGLYLSDKTNVDHRMYDSGDGREKVNVALVKLDEYFPVGTRVDFIKIDVQGHEYSVLKGATRLFGDNPQIACLLEFWPFGLAKAGVKPADVLRFITGLGFTYELVSGAVDIVERADRKVERESEYCNLIISRKRI